MKTWHEILNDEIKHRTIKSVADDLGYARSSISLLFHGRYPGSNRKIVAKIYEIFSREIDCPYLQCSIVPSRCKTLRLASMPTSEPHKLKHWTACQSCPLNVTNSKQEIKNGG